MNERLPALTGTLHASTRRIAIAGADHEEPMAFAQWALESGGLSPAQLLLIGDPARIRHEADELGMRLDGVEVLPAGDPAEGCRLAATAAAEGRASVLAKGMVQTADFLRAVLGRALGLLPTGALISHIALFETPRYHKPFIVTDAAINPTPDADALLRIVANAAAAAHTLGVSNPKIACVAPAEKVSDKVPSTALAAHIVAQVADGELQRLGLAPECRPLAAGPFGFDVAISKEAAQTKGISGPVAGDADIVVFPGLDAANGVYKSLTIFAGASVASVVVGTRVPIVLTSRADSVEAKARSLELALLLAG